MCRQVQTITLWRHVILGAVTLSILIEPALADVTVIAEAKEMVTVTKKPLPFDAVLKTKQEKANGKITTQFLFHEPESPTNDFKKTLKTGAIDNQTFNPKYVGPEKEGTTGDVLYNLKTQKLLDDKLNPKGFETVASAKAKIQPGKAKKEQGVSILARLDDPFSFSNFDINSAFEFNPAGLDLSFSLLEGTSLPTPPLGLINFMSFTQRLAPASVVDPGQFWGDPNSGWIDLFRVSIAQDFNGKLTTSVQFGLSNEFFNLDFRDANGAAFDPSNSSSVDTIRVAITSGFQNGSLGSDLSNLFTVGFVPTAATQEYTTGNQLLLNLSGLETPTPEPVSGALAAAGLATLIYIRHRKFNR